MYNKPFPKGLLAPLLFPCFDCVFIDRILGDDDCNCTIVRSFGGDHIRDHSDLPNYTRFLILDH